jgi:hypothetical protein
MTNILEHLIDVTIKTILLLVVVACVAYPLVNYVKAASNYHQSEINKVIGE